ncbi:hypothetical protein Pla52o_35490 [Novipirellula galeiformis]|uniref:Uncharacterized protein n=1 Tax=Novipirellula galeiformis TaxID=2528004 RepID=A0A5C6CEG6_9BACT|nr:hypothetical protein [Novipirellula galeiformis]TWU22492.1 hypothetical protein Pla52o_35490 [Novipirellula galeiformis]
MQKTIKQQVKFDPRPRGRIDWSVFSDGAQRTLVNGIDFKGPLTSVQSSAHQAAGRLAMVARTLADGENLIVQFFEKPEESFDGQESN